MENVKAESINDKKQLELFFAGQATAGLLSADPNLVNHPEDLKRKVTKVAESLADHYSLVEATKEQVED